MAGGDRPQVDAVAVVDEAALEGIAREEEGVSRSTMRKPPSPAAMHAEVPIASRVSTSPPTIRSRPASAAARAIATASYTPDFMIFMFTASAARRRAASTTSAAFVIDSSRAMRRPVFARTSAIASQSPGAIGCSNCVGRTPRRPSSAASRIASSGVKPPFASSISSASGRASRTARMRATSWSTSRPPTLILRVRNARNARASRAASSTVPVTMVMSVTSRSSAPPKNARSDRPSARASASTIAVSTAHRAEAQTSSSMRSAASRPTSEAIDRSRSASALACVSPLNAGKGAASP